MKPAELYIQIMDRINRGTFIAIAIFIASLALILFVQVFLRYVVHAPLNWSEEVAKYLSIWIVFLGMSVAMRRMSLIAVEAVLQSVPESIGYVMKMLVLSLIIIFCGYLIYIGINVSLDAADQSFASLEVSMSVVYAAMPFGAALTLLNTVVVVIELNTQRNIRI